MKKSLLLCESLRNYFEVVFQGPKNAFNPRQWSASELHHRLKRTKTALRNFTNFFHYNWQRNRHLSWRFDGCQLKSRHYTERRLFKVDTGPILSVQSQTSKIQIKLSVQWDQRQPSGSELGRDMGIWSPKLKINVLRTQFPWNFEQRLTSSNPQK